ncbi:heavy metal-associated isoprenylated plant protein 28 [Beta vulgaris subsp. vulgaris]|uniref:heavy metal-associated isoprenylated plant protein 28 n=1 Tax=Beta vulgaris subsp. vulgaris TaxID=3555 RepID=UPI002036FD7A|nr:heavy metal-associated isoprenylated plant protein 28 [Beta vulgaris subsp. vulgaris]
MSTVTEMRVHMCCPGCESKIKKTLSRMKGVDEVDIDMGMQKVTVNGSAEPKKVLKAVRGTGRRAELWQFPYQPELRSFTHQYPNQCQSNGTAAAAYSGQPQPASSSYNYFKHGYDGHESHGYYNFNNPSHSSSFVGARNGDAFSDENPHACSIM